MKTLASNLTRRDRCHLIGRHGSNFSYYEAATAWYALQSALEELGEMDVPKFNDLLCRIRAAQKVAKRIAKTRAGSQNSQHDEEPAGLAPACDSGRMRHVAQNAPNQSRTNATVASNGCAH